VGDAAASTLTKNDTIGAETKGGGAEIKDTVSMRICLFLSLFYRCERRAKPVARFKSLRQSTSVSPMWWCCGEDVYVCVSFFVVVVLYLDVSDEKHQSCVSEVDVRVSDELVLHCFYRRERQLANYRRRTGL
jgi:hypothetical protein